MISFLRFVLIVLLLVVVAMTSAVITMHFAIHGAEVSIPDFRGMTIAQAVRRGVDLDLNLNVENHFYSTETPAGHIMNQSPAPGTLVRSGWHVRIIESLGPQRVAIPDVTGQQERLGTIEIRRVGLQPGVVAQLPWAGAQPGTIIAQSPQAKASGVESPEVSLLVAEPGDASAGSFVMPDLTGQMFTAAAFAITHAGLQLAPVKDAPVAVLPVGSTASPLPPAPSYPPGAILAQSPAAGERVDASTPVALTVAR
ncbi:PASTA domain-containing protein [Paracidobacterium acidisoli]|uniref:PASTA domain-containing protein n=1 Tax=Paracidobacterium acidisoli TaxID=2303751 RepID=A0A372IL46_9BACT|nr:PASTA domain-containing protein [Paracidobacterium acidisoli]MBT9332855.1 PASTA domain-containing protein [Paracidobacterium acidisoli]